MALVASSPLAEITCLDVGKRFGGVTALQQVSVSFIGGGIVALVGPNGAGKTTLLNVISGHVVPDRGRILLGGVETTGMPAHRVARLGVCRTFQDVRLVADMTVRENLRIGVEGFGIWSFLRPVGKRDASLRDSDIESRCLEAIERVGLGGLAASCAADLSYGQQKLVAFAGSLVMGGQLLLLDEPFSGLDPAMSDRLEGVLRSLKAQSKLVLFVEHNLEVVRRIADRTVVMGQGRIVAEGSAQDVLRRKDVVESFLA